MDKNSVIGIILIFVVLVVATIINKPSQEQIEAAKRRQDSIAVVEAEKAIIEKEKREVIDTLPAVADSASSEKIMQQKIDQLGVFGAASVGEEKFYTLENNLIKITFTNKGGRIYSVELKNFTTYDSLPLILFDGPETLFGLNFFAQNRSIQTDQLYFTPDFSNESIVIDGPPV